MVKGSDLIGSRRIISCARFNDTIHILDFSKDNGNHNTYCGITIKKVDYLFSLQRPEDITCSLCVQEYSQYLNTEYDTTIKAIKVLRRRVEEIRDALVHFQKEPGITREGFYSVLEKITAPIPDGDVARGRPRKGHYKQCKGCGRTIYVRPYRETNDGNYCKDCANKLLQPKGDDGKNPDAVALGRLGGLKGGKARFEKLTPGQRKEIARNAVNTRWHKKGNGNSAQATIKVTPLNANSRCPKCGTRTLERDGTDLHCWGCGHIIYHIFAN